MWTGGDQSGLLSVKNVYNALALKFWPQQISTWRRQLWTWDLAYKIKLFIWLALERKILTWDSLQKRGWVGPSICSLCYRDEESISHLFINCPFTLKLWKNLHIAYNLVTNWGGNSLNNCFENWLKVEKVYNTLPIIVCWYLWLERNRCIFDSCSPQYRGLVFKSEG
jgi:hypothetical protein